MPKKTFNMSPRQQEKFFKTVNKNVAKSEKAAEKKTLGGKEFRKMKKENK